VADTVAQPGQLKSPRTNTQQLAWGVLLISFAAFCVLCVIIAILIYYFLFQSTVPAQSVLRVGRGTVGLTEADLIEQVVRNQRDLFSGVSVSTDPQSQGTIFFRDQQHGGSLIAAVTLKSGSSVSLESANRPRFDWSTVEYRLSITDFSGELELLIPDSLPRDIWFSVETEHGALVYLTASGQYLLRVTDTQVEVVNYAGEALLASPDLVNRQVGPGQRGLLDLPSTEIALLPAFNNLLGNSTFQATNIAELGINGGSDVRELPIAWRCSNVQNDFPRGDYGITQDDGRTVLRFLRGSGANSHGETSCGQYFGPTGTDGLDVSMYDHLQMRATLKIRSHSLSTCGIEGSECPLMLRIDYIDVNNRPQVWYHGFFTTSNLNLNYPLRCSSCTQEHEAINAEAWYTYDSGNLFRQLPVDQRPKSLLNVRFYASGHEYDVALSEVALLAGQVENLSG
jgi:hypothetical protein